MTTANTLKQKHLITFPVIFLFLMFNAQSADAGTLLKGSGASFPYQIYSLWFMLVEREHKDLNIEYIPKGSGGGIRDFIAHNVDFAASDAAMKDDEIAKIPEGVQLLPMTAGEVVLTYNLPGIDDLKLPRAVYPEIFLGNITKWNDAAIATANPSVQLPDLEITVVTRADSSGTTFVFSKHLSTISTPFKDQVGFGKKIGWPEKHKIKKAPLNAGLAAIVKQTPGAIGYIDFGFATLANLQTAHLENREGNYIAPGLEGGQAALAHARIPENMIVWLSDPAGRDSYPITTFTWMMFYKKYDDPDKAELLRKMIIFCLEQGQKISDRVGYIPLPENVSDRVRSALKSIK